MSAAAGGLAALRRRAALTPDEPFLFFRDSRGQFAWWSWRRAAEAAEAPAGEATDAPREYLRALHDDLPASREAAVSRLQERLGGAGERQIWYSSRPLDRGCEGLLARAAVEAGWAVVRDPGPRPSPQTVLWARPTLLAGESGELVELCAAMVAGAPRWRRSTWLRRRTRRWRAVLIDGPLAPELAASLREVEAHPAVLSSTDLGW